MTESENQQPQKGLAWVGRKLKEAREQRQLSLSHVAKVTRINALVLEEIESGELKKSPSAVFLRGFIRTYSELLGVGDEEFQQELERIPELQEVPTHDAQILAPIKTDEKGIGAKYFVILALFIVLGGGYVLFDSYWGSIGSIFNDTNEATTQSSVGSPQSENGVPSKGTADAVVQGNTSGKGSVQGNTTVLAEKKPITPSPQKVTSEVAKLDPVTQKTEEKEDLVIEQITVSTTPTTTLFIQPKPFDTLILRVLAINSSWLNIKVDKQASLDILLQTGEEYSLEAQDQFLLTVGNTKGVQVFLNGQFQEIDRETDLLENWLLNKSTLETQ